MWLLRRLIPEYSSGVGHVKFPQPVKSIPVPEVLNMIKGRTEMIKFHKVSKADN